MSMQVATVCTQLKGLKELKKGFNAVGFSQGGQFLRVRDQGTSALIECRAMRFWQANGTLALPPGTTIIVSLPGWRPACSTDVGSAVPYLCVLQNGKYGTLEEFVGLALAARPHV